MLYINDCTGFIDIKHSDNPDILFAAALERDRKACNFKENGNGSGLYKSVNKGESWKKIIKGLPENGIKGRIGLDIHLANPDIIYAVIDNQKRLKKNKKSCHKTHWIFQS